MRLSNKLIRRHARSPASAFRKPVYEGPSQSCRSPRVVSTVIAYDHPASDVLAKRRHRTDAQTSGQDARCILLQASLPLRLNIRGPNNGQAQDTVRIPQGHQARYTGELLLRTRPKTYRAIARELAEPNASVNGISRRYRVSNHTVMGIREREAKA